MIITQDEDFTSHDIFTRQYSSPDKTSSPPRTIVGATTGRSKRPSLLKLGDSSTKTLLRKGYQTMLMTKDSTLTPEAIITSQWEFIGEATIPPEPARGLSVKLVVGEYEATMPQPALVLLVEPDPSFVADAFVADLQRLDEGDTYRLVYFFENFGGPTYHVKVWERVG